MSAPGERGTDEESGRNETRITVLILDLRRGITRSQVVSCLRPGERVQPDETFPWPALSGRGADPVIICSGQDPFEGDFLLDDDETLVDC